MASTVTTHRQTNKQQQQQPKWATVSAQITNLCSFRRIIGILNTQHNPQYSLKLSAKNNLLINNSIVTAAQLILTIRKYKTKTRVKFGKHEFT